MRTAVRTTMTALTLLFTAAQSDAATFVVTRFDDPPINSCAVDGCSLREAAAEAAAPGNDTISLAAGEYVLSEQGSVGVTVGVPSGTSFVGAGTSLTTIRANGIGSMFLVGGGAASFSRLTIRDGNADGNVNLSTFGGAIRVYQGHLTLDRVALRDNHASQGGALYLEESGLELRNSTLEGNDSGFGGGAIQLHDTPATIYRSVLENNIGSSGGGIRATGSPVTLQAGSILSGNSAIFGGGALISDDLVLIDDTCRIIDNVAPHGGAFSSFGGHMILRGVVTGHDDGLVEVSGNRAVRADGYGSGGAISASTRTTIERLALVQNEADYSGGAIQASQTTLTIRDSRIAENLAGNHAGGVLLYDANATLERVAFDGNVATNQAGALYLVGANHKTTLRNVDIYDNSAASSASIFNASQLSLSHVTIWNNLAGNQRDAVQQYSTGSTFYSNSVMLGRCTGTTASISAAGKNLRTSEFALACTGTVASAATLQLSRGNFGGLFPISGTTAAGSALINSGASLYCVATDIRNAARVGTCDVGAFEYGATP
jgi:hypothetical protein